MQELSKEENYKYTIIETINFLNTCREGLQIKLINIAMAGDWHNASKLFDEGDTITVSLSDLKNADDINVQVGIRQIKMIDATIDYLIANNDIDEAELGET